MKALGFLPSVENKEWQSGVLHTTGGVGRYKWTREHSSHESKKAGTPKVDTVDADSAPAKLRPKKTSRVSQTTKGVRLEGLKWKSLY